MRPFFILGAPRSGTTMLRDIFKQIDEYYSPEETHFFRWAAPYRGFEYTRTLENNGVLKKHRRMDGITDDRFFDLYEASNTRAEFTEAYCSEVARNNGAKSWFEKTPQNVYGLPLLIDQFPKAKIIHLVRHPLSVTKSLMTGKVMKPQSFIGGLNYWREAVSIVNVLKPVMGGQLIEVRYEDIQADPKKELSNLLMELGLSEKKKVDVSHVSSKIKIPTSEFSASELATAERLLGKYMKNYGYTLDALVSQAGD